MPFGKYTQSAIDAISPYLRTVGNRDNRVEAMKQRIFGIAKDTGTAIGNIFAREQRKREVNIGAEDVNDIQARINALKAELADVDQQIELLSSHMDVEPMEAAKAVEPMEAAKAVEPAKPLGTGNFYPFRNSLEPGGIGWEVNASKLNALKERKRAIESEIANLEVELAYKSKLKTLQNDPQWRVAAQQYINTGDSSGINAVMSTLNANAQAEQNRKITADQLKHSKYETDLARLDEAKYDLQKAELQRENAHDAYINQKNTANKKVLDSAELNLKQATEKFNKLAKRLGETETTYAPKSQNDKYDPSDTGGINNLYENRGETAIAEAKKMSEDGYFDNFTSEKLDNAAKTLESLDGMRTKINDADFGPNLDKIKANIDKRRNDLTKSTKAVEDAKNTKIAFKNNNATKTFEMNFLTKEPFDQQEWIDFEKKAKEAGWNVELQPNGTILWK